MEHILKDNDVIALDTGQIYRFVTFKIYEKIKDEINIDKITQKDNDEIIKITELIYHLTRYYSHQLSQLTFDKNKLYEDGNEIDRGKLYIREVNILLPIVARISTVRNKISQFINCSLCDNSKSVIMTGHNIKEIDTTKFIVVYLDVDSKTAAYRLFNRNAESYSDLIDAYDEVNQRNSTDKIEFTKEILPFLYQYIYIDTVNKSAEEIYQEYLDKIKILKEKEQCFIKLQRQSINRKEFTWITNVVLQPIKEMLQELASAVIEKYPYINKSDLIYQTIILLTAYDLKNIYNCDEDFSLYLNDCVIRRDESVLNILKNKINNREIKINIELILSLLTDSTLKFLKLYEDENVRKVMLQYNKKQKDLLLKTSTGLMIKRDDCDYITDKISFRVLDFEMSKFISTYCHYLHTPRSDELISYGAFRNDEKYPIAYVSFSKHDREYKKELLYFIGIEPQNTIEMTRAWCADSAPFNIMSSLFQFSIDDISEKWKIRIRDGYEDKLLQAITTTVNPNLGFTASSFLGCNFIPIALRPARFTFAARDNAIRYVTRREIQLQGYEDIIFENKFEILPLNELMLCLDKIREYRIADSNIFLIDKNDYDSVLMNSGNRKVKKHE